MNLNSNVQFRNVAVSVIAALLMIIGETVAIKCYRCTIGPTSRINLPKQLCAHFQETNEFVVDCPYSTMCMKKVFNYELLDGKVIQSVNRDCAHQKYAEQVFKEGAWQKEITIEEPYEPGCIVNKDIDNERSTVYCHCRGSYCNAAHKTIASLTVNGLISISVILSSINYVFCIF